MSATKQKKTDRTFEELRTMTEYFRSIGVVRFAVGDVSVDFGVNAIKTSKPGRLDELDDMGESNLDFIKQSLKAANDKADEDLLWST